MNLSVNECNLMLGDTASIHKMLIESDESLDKIHNFLDYLEKGKRSNIYNLELWLTSVIKIEVFIDKLIKENIPYDDYVTILKSIYEESLFLFPSNDFLWIHYCKFTNKISGRKLAHDIFNRAFKNTRSLGLIIQYLQFVYDDGHIFPLLNALDFSLNYIGFCMESNVLWRQLLKLRIKLYNTYNMQITNTPNSNFIALEYPFVDHETECESCNKHIFTDDQLDLLIMAAKDIIFSFRSISNDPNINNNMYRSFTEVEDVNYSFQLENRFSLESSIELIRTLYKNWLTTPMGCLNIVWKGYCQLEDMILSKQSISKHTLNPVAKPLLSSNIYKLSEEMYKKLISPSLYGGFSVNPINFGGIRGPAIPVNTKNFYEYKVIVQRWYRIFDYEEKNPLKLSKNLYIKRMSSLYRFSLDSCGFISIIWLSYFQFFVKHEMIQEAIEILEYCLSYFLRDDEFMYLVLAYFLYTNNQMNKAIETLLSCLANCIISEKKNEVIDKLEKLVKCILVDLHVDFKVSKNPLISYPKDSITNYLTNATPGVSVFKFLLNCIRLSKTIEEVHETFLLLYSILPKQVIWYYARFLWYNRYDILRIRQVLSLGDERFSSDPEYIIEHAKILLEMQLREESEFYIFNSIKKIYQNNNKTYPSIIYYLRDSLTYYGTFNPNVLRLIEKELTLMTNQIDLNHYSLNCIEDFLNYTHLDDSNIDASNNIIQNNASTTWMELGLPKDVKDHRVFMENLYDQIQSSYCFLNTLELYRSFCFGLVEPKSSIGFWIDLKSNSLYKNIESFKSIESITLNKKRNLNDTNSDHSKLLKGKDDISDKTESHFKKYIKNGAESFTKNTIPNSHKLEVEKMVPLDTRILESTNHVTSNDTLWVSIPTCIQNFVKMLPKMYTLKPTESSVVVPAFDSKVHNSNIKHEELVDHLMMSLKDVTIPLIEPSDYQPIPNILCDTSLPTVHPFNSIIDSDSSTNMKFNNIEENINKVLNKKNRC